jgi:hypothetical protein
MGNAPTHSTLNLACSLQATAFSSSRPSPAACEPASLLLLHLTAAVDLFAAAALACLCGTSALRLELIFSAADGASPQRFARTPYFASPSPDKSSSWDPLNRL